RNRHSTPPNKASCGAEARNWSSWRTASKGLVPLSPLRGEGWGEGRAEEVISVSRSQSIHNSLTTPGKDERCAEANLVHTKGVSRHETRFRFGRIAGHSDPSRHRGNDSIQRRIVGGGELPLAGDITGR